jgi:hypothetical protein
LPTECSTNTRKELRESFSLWHVTVLDMSIGLKLKGAVDKTLTCHNIQSSHSLFNSR